MHRIAAIVLAAGGSSRMGSPKQLLRYEGTSLIRRAVEAALGSGCDGLRVVLGAEADAVRAELAGLACEVVSNPEWRRGVGSSIAVGVGEIASARSPAFAAVLIVLADQPHVDADHLGRLVASFDGTASRAVATAYADTVGAPTLFGRAHFDALCALEGDRGARRLVAEIDAEGGLVRVPFEGAALDIDTPEDYRALVEAR